MENDLNDLKKKGNFINLSIITDVDRCETDSCQNDRYQSEVTMMANLSDD